MVEITPPDGSAKNVPDGQDMSIDFAQYIKLRLRDLNKYMGWRPENRPFFKYTKDDITKFLANPAAHEKDLRRAVRYIYGASSNFRRLIQYFVGLSDLAYIVAPYRTDYRDVNVRTTNINYRKVLNMLSSMNIKTQLPNILTVCLREDTFFGTLWVTKDSITIQQLPSDYCQISTIEGNVLNVTFDFSYFSKGNREDLLDYYPPEFRRKYSTYKERGKKKAERWIELDAPTSFAVKCNTDILDYSIPPFVGILREIYDIEDYKQLKLAKTAIENYAMLAMYLPMDEDGNWAIDYDRARAFWENLDDVLPEEIGSVLTPMKIDKISFEKSNTGDVNTVAEATQDLFTGAGVSSLLFNNEKASANALLLSIKADQALTYGIVKSIQDVINRFLQAQPYGKYFTVNFLDCSPYNRKELGDAYLKAATYGLPTISMYAATQGLGQAELDAMSFLEGQVLGLQDLFRPIQSSAQMSSSDLESDAPTEEGGRPTKDIGELTDSGEQSSEDKDDWG